MVPSLSLIGDPSLSGLIEKLYSAETQAAAVKSVTGEKNDAAIEADTQIAKIKDDIADNMGSIRSNLLFLKSRINSEIADNNYLLKKVPEQERVFLDISRQQAVKNKYLYFSPAKKRRNGYFFSCNIRGSESGRDAFFLWADQPGCQ